MKKRKLSGESFNFSHGNPMTVIEIVKKIYGLTGEKPNYKILNEVKYEIKHQYLNSQKAEKILAWKPKVTINEGIKKIIEEMR
jgi:nucleoside-diphosphate-sugar epimerase